MTDKLTELAKKHGASYSYDHVLMTFDQLRAIIKEARAPLVESIRWASGKIDERYVSACCDDDKYLKFRKTLAEFNKEFGDD